jgi:argininosuccinate lyase/amino-acid N-acetyltransferase
MALWGGRFESASDPLFKRFNDSLSFDCRLLPQDIEGSIAWAAALRRTGVLSEPERASLEVALRAIAEEWSGLLAEVATSGEEDVHSFVEARLVERVGPLGKKLHTGRSRNDQVATDLRLWCRAAIDERVAELRGVRRSLLELARREQGTVFPGYTHLQRAQPVLLAHWALAYAEMLGRDASRFKDARARADQCPLGSGALAGTAFPIDRAALAADLGFAEPTTNSLDAVSDRDFVVDALAASSLCAVHLSRLAEDLIIYSTGEFAMVELSDDVTSGSSLMPQKKNPDALELIRGKAGRIMGAHTALCVTLKGLPLAYNKDMQEDKEPLFDAMDHLSLCLRMLPRVLDGAKVDRAAALRAAKGGHANATELADYLVAKGVPFRDAHEVAGRAVRAAIEKGGALEDLSVDELRAAHPTIGPLIGPDVYDVLKIEALLARRTAHGSAGAAPVAGQIARLSAELGPV